MRFVALLPSLLILAASVAGAAEKPSAAKGEQLYKRPGLCITCHQATGAGLPGAFPPLAGSDWIYESPEILTKIVLHGVQGPITVNNKKYATAMPGQGAQLKDQEVADILTYVRSAWGNTGDPVTADVVAKVRAENATRKTMWTVKELKP